MFMNSVNQSVSGNGNFIQTSGQGGKNVVQINDMTIKVTKDKVSIKTPNQTLIVKVNGVEYTPKNSGEKYEISN